MKEKKKKKPGCKSFWKKKIPKATLCVLPSEGKTSELASKPVGS